MLKNKLKKNNLKIEQKRDELKKIKNRIKKPT
jgi:hypothetical protein